MAHDVFISHSARDKPYADAVCAKLESRGLRCWIAPRAATAPTVIARARTRSKWIVRSIAALVIALVGTARDAAPQQVQKAAQDRERAQAEPEAGAFGTSIGDLRKRGLDIVLVIDGTGSMNLIIDDLRARMPQLVQSIHRLVPIARIGIIVFGGKGEKMTIQPLTLSPQELSDFLNTIGAMGSGEWEEDTLGACQTAMEKMDWKPYARKVVVLVGDSPPRKEDFTPLLALIRKFKDNNGTFNAVDVAAEEHERFEREFWLKHHHKEPPKLSPLPEFYRQTAQAYRVLAAAGDGDMQELPRNGSIDRVIFRLISAKVPPKIEVPPKIPRYHDYYVPIARTPRLCSPHLEGRG
jgi:Mg-chelatase subunit ChlD